jgi:DNA-binding SARP family transcriptional activator/TolB-like protein
MRAPRSKPKDGIRAGKPRLEIATFGKFSLRVDGRDVPIVNRKSRALIGFLALSDRGEQTRERIVGALWSEFEEAKARASLRQALYEVREALEKAGFPGLQADKLSVRLDTAGVAIDLADILRDAEAGRAHALLIEREHIADKLLEEFETVDSAFRVWLLAKRQSFHDRTVQLLEAALRAAAPNDARRQDLARALSNLDATHEEAARELIRTHVALGDIGAALRVYKSLWDLLENEYDVEPSKETQELIAAVRMAQPVPGAVTASTTSTSAPMGLISVVAPPDQRLLAPAPAKAEPKLIVAISVFEAAGALQDHTHLVQGFRRDLIARLVRFREWLIRDQAFGLRTANGDSIEYVIEGSALQHRGDAVLVLTLRNTTTGDYLWSERVPVALETWFDAQQEIVQRIASSLNVYVSAGRLSAVVRSPSSNLKAYDRWLRAQARLVSWSPEKWHEAEDLLKEIIGDTPNFAPAYSSLAALNTSMHFYHPGAFRSREREQHALDYSRHATELDPTDARGQLALGWAYAMMKNYDNAAAHHITARELNDCDPWILTSGALGCAFRGEYDKAKGLCDQAFVASPSPSPAQWGYRAEVSYLCGNYDDAAEAAGRASRIVHMGGWKAAALARAGHRQDAGAALHELFDTVRGQWFGRAHPTADEITRWFLHLFPIKSREDWERLREGFEAAGAPRTDLQHHAW